MKKILLAGLVAFPTFCLAQYTYENLEVNFLETDAKAKYFTYENLRLYPIKARESFKSRFKNIGKYVPLKQALESKKIKITEKSSSESVHDLTIENISNDTIIIIVGEVIKGGKQDRIVNKDIVLAPKSGKKVLPVYCVEKGRWTYNTPSSKKEFNDYYKVGSMELRKVVEKEKNQGKVWEKVDEITTANKTKSSTSTYTALNQSTTFNKKLESYSRFFKEKFAKEHDVIGVIVVTGDKVIGCDMFATPDLFQQNFTNLLSSYITDAILSGSIVTISSVDVKRYMNPLLTNENTQKAELKKKGNSFSDKGNKLRVSSYE
jgi:hypothetical protein